MVNRLGIGSGGWSSQLKMSLDRDAGLGLKRVEEQLVLEVFRVGTRSDVQRLLLRHFVDHPPDVVWMRKVWRRPLGEGWPEVPSQEVADKAPPSAPLAEGGGA